VQRDIQTQLALPPSLVFKRSFDRPNLFYRVEYKSLLRDIYGVLALAIKKEIEPFVGQAAVAATSAGGKAGGKGGGGGGGGGGRGGGGGGVSFSSSAAAVAAAAARGGGGGGKGGGPVHPFFQPRPGASTAAAKAAVVSVVASVAGREGGREGGSAIVYCWKRVDCDLLAAELTKRGVPTRAYHAGIRTNDREEVQRLFCKGVIKVVTASCAFGMGIDKADVRLVVHWTVWREGGREGGIRGGDGVM